MITEKQVEHVIIPMPHEHFIILVPNLAIIFLTVILIGFYIRQGASIRQRIADRQNRFSEIHSTASLPNNLYNSISRSLSNKTKSLMNFTERGF